MQRDKTGRGILNFIRQKAFEIIMDMGSSGILKVSLKDMNFDIKDYYSPKTLHLETKGLYAKLNAPVKIYNADLFKIAYMDESKYDSFTFTVKNFNEIFMQKEMFDIHDNTHIGLVRLNMYDGDFVIKDIKSSSSVRKNSDNTLNTNFDMKIADFAVNSKQGNIEVKNLNFALKIAKIDAVFVKNIQQNLQNNPYGYVGNYAIQCSIQQLLNKKLNTNVSLSFDQININSRMFNKIFNTTKADLTFDIRPNNVYLRGNIDKLMNYINATLHLQTTTQNLHEIEQMEHSIEMYAQQFVKIKGDKAVVDIKYNNGILTVNGKQISLQ